MTRERINRVSERIVGLLEFFSGRALSVAHGDGRNMFSMRDVLSRQGLRWMRVCCGPWMSCNMDRFP